MAGLRARAERDLSRSLEGDWGVPVELITPDGVKISTSANTGESLMGQVLYEQIKVNPDTGEDIVVDEPVITLRRSSLSRIPAYGERWIIRFPVDPSEGATMISHFFSTDRSPEGGRSLGIIRIMPSQAVQLEDAINVIHDDETLLDGYVMTEETTVMGP